MDDSTALIQAAQHGHETTVQLLLDRGANIHVKNFYGRTALDLAADNGRESTVRLLLNRGKFEARDTNVWTALLVAADSGHVSTVRLLLDRGVNVNGKDRWGTGGGRRPCSGLPITDMKPRRDC
jgi:ankyrin repeat protein